MLSSLEVNFSFPVKIGVSPSERAHPQIILVDIIFEYNLLPEVCKTDNLTADDCYHQLYVMLEKFLSSAKFNTIDYLASQVINLVSNKIKSINKIKVSVSKTPKDLNGKAKFSIEKLIPA